MSDDTAARQAWLASLRKGDRVLVDSHWNRHVATIDKVTPTGRIVVQGVTYRDGSHQQPHGVTFSTLYPATPEVIADMRDRAEWQRLVANVASRWYTPEALVLLREAVAKTGKTDWPRPEPTYEVK